ncbi:Disintegrin and metalloproteinase domain-containing protein 10 [Toxocara canis]|uniref:Disintegrin and metalloproteinase domain-containing protein 10 n=1 Tax=Toxocara canis TaxID=6265 RepID=A0A0B2V0F7_TOXCA|nr:Disintegrin and metalloproteinase domain-containing protein 10 [Toxocara canis]
MRQFISQTGIFQAIRKRCKFEFIISEAKRADVCEGFAEGKSLNSGVVTLLDCGSSLPPCLRYIIMAHEIGHNFGSNRLKGKNKRSHSAFRDEQLLATIIGVTVLVSMFLVFLLLMRCYYITITSLHEEYRKSVQFDLNAHKETYRALKRKTPTEGASGEPTGRRTVRPVESEA